METAGGFFMPTIDSRPSTPAPPTATTDSPAASAQGEATSAPADGAGPAPSSNHQRQPTLDEELASVVSSIGSFWGKVRKQSVAAYANAEKQIDQYATTAKADLTPFVSKARANLDTLSEQTKAEFQRISDNVATAASQVSAGGDGAATGTSIMIGADGTPVIVDTPIAAPVVDKGKGVDRAEHTGTGDAAVAGTPSTTATGEPLSPPTSPLLIHSKPAIAATAFFTKMQSQLASNAQVAQMSKNLQTSLTNVQTNLSHLPQSIQQIQSQLPTLDQKTAEGYLSKGEHWFAEFSGEVSRLAKDAVRVVPPTGVDEKNKKREERLRKAEQVAVGRTDTLIQKLRADSALLSIDPAKPAAVPSAEAGSTEEKKNKKDAVVGESGETPVDTREAFSKFLQTVEDNGGFEGATWAARVAHELEADEAASGAVLKRTRDGLVGPGKLTQEAFWSRYFFRKEEIEGEEKRRKEVLLKSAGAEEEEDFSWDLDDEEDSTPGASSSAIGAPLPTDAAAPATPTPASYPHSSPPTSDKQKSPRASSDGASSYDVVGEQSGTPSEAGGEEERSPAVGGGPTPVPVKKEAESDGDDSDWE
ncbi:hypothetical protein T439DRAFT_326076 [Meredithblackwellia eburnea MCA 4105]